MTQCAVVLFADGTCVLICAADPGDVAADEIVRYPARWFATLRQEQPAVIVEAVVEQLKKRKAHHVAVDDAPVGARLAQAIEVSSIDQRLWSMRRAKDPDELALMKVGIACTEAMYARAREIIAPGVRELDVFNELHAAAVNVAGEPLSALLGNDFACGVPGGAARKDRIAQDGELYILDLGPAYRGYFADNARAFAVNRKPTDAQHRAWEMIVGVFPIVEKLARPGTRCREIFEVVDQHFHDHTGAGIAHHLGHGVGLQPHEYPHLNPRWDDVLIEGEFFTVEPGIYSKELAGGMRIENNYVVTKDGVECLTPFAMELA